jgi:hypothetical protein
MPIKGPDGKPYKIRTPNPMMATQTFWDRSHVTILNMGWDTVVIPDARKNDLSEVEKHYTKLTPIEEFMKPNVEEPTPEPFVIPEKPKEVPKPPEPEPQPVVEAKPPTREQALDKRLQEMMKLRKTTFHCLPTHWHKDALYGERRATYGQKFVFPGIIAKQDDMTMTFWSQKEFELASIIYPMTEEKRWWKTGKSTASAGGYLTECVISELSPSFED